MLHPQDYTEGNNINERHCGESSDFVSQFFRLDLRHFIDQTFVCADIDCQSLIVLLDQNTRGAFDRLRSNLSLYTSHTSPAAIRSSHWQTISRCGSNQQSAVRVG